MAEDEETENKENESKGKGDLTAIDLIEIGMLP